MKWKFKKKPVPKKKVYKPRLWKRGRKN